MNVDEEAIRKRSTDAVFERGETYRKEGRIQRLDRFDDLVTAAVSGSKLYDVTIEFGGRNFSTNCTCPYDGSGDCKHVVAVLLDIAAGPPDDESEGVEGVLEDVSADDLGGFVRDALAEDPELREQFLAQFGDDHKSVGEYREEIAHLFEQHADPGVYDAIDFSRFFEIAEQYRDRDRYLAAATVYRAVFEEVDEKSNWIDGAYDHYAKIIQRAIDGYADCVLATDPSPEEFDTYAGVLEARASTEPPINNEQFRRELDDLEERYDE
ncbi:SWIM zinc finger domain-containing protein [Halorhabdus tiamatea SARL4B]|uniref:SWIM zinc finger domain-containing protein n=1 Tax=Halorhabdus tiamatea SARL4B TaxID=1033806 RepID=F7PK24_9EURY|nr:SWIM zinc finger family protein [Halorhabdus tiamatea]ERJ07557.1 SWIM zinc finger domain-containing protein [Halorhabdus tiamatea SARL4B]CCQ33494.1 zinc finger SWIM domain-containing protein [Halorhabdus tiamatea SARL4B]